MKLQHLGMGFGRKVPFLSDFLLGFQERGEGKCASGFAYAHLAIGITCGSAGIALGKLVVGTHGCSEEVLKR